MSTVRFAHQLSTQLVDDLMSLTSEDMAWQRMKPIAEEDKAYMMMSILYIKYILITNSFAKLANMTVTYQKRERLKPILSNLYGRILELKAEMAKLSKTDLPYLDRNLMAMELTRRDIELVIPDFYRMERSFVVKEFFRFTEKIKDGLVLKSFPKKPVPEITLDLRKYYLAEAKAREIAEREHEGRRIERMLAEEQRANKGRGILDTSRSPGKKRPPKFDVATGRGEIRKIMQLMGTKRHRVFQAMKTVLKQPVNEPYESWKFPYSRDVVRAPYFLGKKYFHNYNLLINPLEYGKFSTAIALIQKHERARYGVVYFMIRKERWVKMFEIQMNLRKGLKTDLLTSGDYRYPTVIRDPRAMHRKSQLTAPSNVKRINMAVKVFGLLPEPSRNPDFCARYSQYKSRRRKIIQQTFQDYIKAEARGEEELAKNETFKELDIIEEILEYFRVWLDASKPMVARYGWDLLDIPDPNRKVLPPPNFVAGIPKVFTDQYVKHNFSEITNVVQRGPPLSGTALIVTGNHITPEQYMTCKPLGLARQAMPKEAREAEEKKLKEQEKKLKEKAETKRRGKEEEGYKPQKSQIPLFVLQRIHDLQMAHQWEETEIHPVIVPKNVDEEDMEWKTATRLHLQLREGVDRKMIALQKEARQKMTKKHRKAENLKKRNIPALKKTKKEWSLGEQEKWDIIYGLAKEGYFRNYRNKILSNMPGANNFSYANYEYIEEYLNEPEPAWGELYQLAKLWCILPLADLNIRQYGPLVSAVGFVGPREVINHLVCSVAHETGSILICIDPSRPEGNIPLNQLPNMINKLAKSAQPAVILVDNCHLLYRKKEKGYPLELSPYTKVVAKIKKGINRKFRVLLIGATERPDLTNPGKMSKVFDKIIPFPYKDYHSAADYWGKYFFQHENLATNFPYPALVEPTKTYKVPEITRVFNENPMTKERINDFALTPLKVGEFIQPLIRAKALDVIVENMKINLSGYAWASASYKPFKARKKKLKALHDERQAQLVDSKDKKKKKK